MIIGEEWTAWMKDCPEEVAMKNRATCGIDGLNPVNDNSLAQESGETPVRKIQLWVIETLDGNLYFMQWHVPKQLRKFRYLGSRNEMENDKDA